MNDLLQRHCLDYPVGTPPLDSERVSELAPLIPEWSTTSGVRIQREYRFPSFLAAVVWVQKIAQIAEAENHHPTIHISYKKVLLELNTHTVKGLSENDFILAAKFDLCFSQFAL